MFFCFFCIYVSSFCILWVASIVDLRVFWQPGSVTIVLNWHDCCLFESNKYLLLLLLPIAVPSSLRYDTIRYDNDESGKVDCVVNLV